MIALYLRKSRADEEFEEETLSRHRAILLEFAEKNDLHISKIYEEIVSGESIAARPQMLHLLQEVESGMYDAVLCMDIDRLGRGSMQEQGIILDTFKRANTRIITPRKTYDLSDEFDEDYTEFEAFMARKELKIIKRRLRRGIERSVDEGCYIPAPPYGYEKAKLNGKPSIIPHPEQTEVVKMIFDMYANQYKSPNDIAQKLNLLGLKTMRGKRWIPATIRSILKNPTYIGKIVWKKSLRADGLHEPIIDIELFQKAQETIQNRYTPPTFDGTIKNPFAGILYCGICGFAMSRRPYKNKPARYVCRCVKSSRVDLVEKIILDALGKWLTDYEEFNHETLPKPIYNLKNELKNLEFQKRNLYDLLERGTYNEKTFNERARDIDSRITAFQTFKTKPPVTLPKIENALQIYPLLTDPAEKNRLLKSVIKKAVYHRNKETFELTIYPCF